MQKRFNLIIRTDRFKTPLMRPKYKYNFLKCLTKITSISKLRTILLTNSYIFLFYKKKCKLHCRPARQITLQTGLPTDTGYPVQTPNLHIKFTFLNKKGNYFFYDIQLYKHELRVRTGNPIFLSRRGFCFTLYIKIFDSCIFY